MNTDQVRGVEGKAPVLNVICARPGCPHFSTERHHLFPRSWLRGQPYEWVLLPNGQTVPNSVGLCTTHHGHVTGGVGGHKAWIALDEVTFEFVWCDRDRRREEW